ncbi:MAG: META domain-containing protein [Saprospirales bacterium]|nr:MAG: META domain-containing protein [Saprospirales bacterium]
MLAILLVTSCDTPELNEKPDDFSWEIKMIISEDHRKGGISQEIYPLTFDTQEKKAQLQLDVNVCFVDYEINGKFIQFEDLYCTRICCDSKYAEDFAAYFFGEIFEWKIGATDLELSRDGVKLYFRKL